MGARRYYKTPPRTPLGVARNIFGKALRYGASAVASQSAKRFVNTATQTMTRSSGAQNMTTNQYDTVSQYRYKRMPKGKRRRWVKKVKANAAMDYALAATRTVVYNASLEMPIRHTTGFTQGIIATHLYGLNGDGGGINGYTWEFGQSDLNYLVSTDPAIIPPSGKLNKFRFNSAVLDITCRNSSEANLGLEVDLYVITYKTESEYRSFYRLHLGAVSALNDSTGATGTTNLSLEKRGVTPFDITTMASFGVKILSKRKIFLPNGQTFTYQIRDPKNHAYGSDNIYDNQGYVIPYQTKTLLCIFKPIVGGNVADAKLTMGATRTYRYSIIGQNNMAGNTF